MPTSLVREARCEVANCHYNCEFIVRLWCISIGFEVWRVGPLLKKSTRDPAQFTSYCNVSNLPLLSKVIEETVALCLNSYTWQGSQWRIPVCIQQLHSTAAALVCFANDILHFIDEKKAVLLLLLDLSAAFDTVDHNVLLDCMFRRLGIQDTSLSWFRSYLSDRSQVVQIDASDHNIMWLLWSVPQRAVLDPRLFSIYSELICDNTHKHGINIHTYSHVAAIIVIWCIWWHGRMH